MNTNSTSATGDVSNSGRWILITGCSSGIGLAAAKALQDRGYRVIAACKKSQDLEVLQAQGFGHVVELDLSNSNSISAAVGKILTISNGDLFAVFNNGAYGQPGAVEDLSRSALEQQFSANVFGTHELTRALLPIFLRRGNARIIQNSSVLGLVGMSYRGAYCASKYALEALSDVMRLELKNTGVCVSLIEPGPILSRFRANSLEAFERNIDIPGSRHRDAYEQALARLKTEGAAVPFTLGPEAVVKKVIHALESDRPKPRYYVTFPTYLLGFLKRLCSSRVLDYLVRRIEKA